MVLAFRGISNPALEFSHKRAGVKMLARSRDRIGSAHVFLSRSRIRSAKPTYRDAVPAGSGATPTICFAKRGENATISTDDPGIRTGRVSGRIIMKMILRASAVCLLFAGSAVALTGE